MIASFSGGAHRRAAGPAGILVRDRDGWRNAVDPLGHWLFEPLQKLPRIGGEAIDVPPLPLRIEGVQRQARLSATAQAAQDDQLAMRDIEIDLFQVVDRDTAESNRTSSHIGLKFWGGETFYH